MPQLRINLRARMAISIVAAVIILLPPAIAFGHAVVYPKASTTGAYEKYALRVPNERAVATTKVEMTFPVDIRVSSFADVPGWQLEVVTDSAKRIIGATWTGSLAPHRFVEFPFVAVNPKTAAQVTWPVYQTYADGERVAWTGPAGDKKPASVTTISDAAPAVAPPRAASSWIAWTALAVAFVSLGLALRRASAA